MADTRHDRIAKQIAKLHGAKYNRGKGPDIKTPQRVIEVETELDTLGEGIKQLQGFRRQRYLAVPNEMISDAVERTKKLKTGVMNQRGQVVKPAKK